MVSFPYFYMKYVIELSKFCTWNYEDSHTPSIPLLPCFWSPQVPLEMCEWGSVCSHWSKYRYLLTLELPLLNSTTILETPVRKHSNPTCPHWASLVTSVHHCLVSTLRSASVKAQNWVCCLFVGLLANLVILFCEVRHSGLRVWKTRFKSWPSRSLITLENRSWAQFPPGEGRDWWVQSAHTSWFWKERCMF